MRKKILEIKNIDVHYGLIHALRCVSLDIFSGELVSLIGANGAGKTTLLKSIVGLLPVKNGNIIYSDCDITKISTHSLVSKGLTLVPEGRGIFPHMTVFENLQMGAYHRSGKQVKDDLDHIFNLFPRLAERQHQTCATLSGGEQQMVAIGRALMSKPNLLLLDEPSMGLAPQLVQKILEVIQTINREGVSVLLVEQNANAALSLAGRAYVMEHGKITLTGNTQDLMNNTAVKTAYLGG